MKKVNSKLSLNRETLVTLSPEALDGVNGGNAVITTARIVTRYLCPRISQLVGCPGGGGGNPGPQAGGQGGEK